MTIASPAITCTRRLLDGLLLALVVVSLGVVVLGRVVLFVISLGLVLLVLGVLLESTGVRPEVVRAPAPPASPIPTFERATVKEVVAASRERRARRTHATTEARRAQPGA